MMDFQTARWLIDGEVAQQAGNYHPTSIPTGVYKARDGYMNIAVFGSKIWERFCDHPGRAGVDRRPSLTTTSQPFSVNRDSLNAEINRAPGAARPRRTGSSTSTRRRGLRPHQRRAARCSTKPQVQHLGMVQDVVSARLGPQRLVGQPMRWSARPADRARSAAPRRTHRRGAGELGLAAERPPATEIQRSFLMSADYLSPTERVQVWTGRCQHAAHPLQQPGAPQRAERGHVGGRAAAAGAGRRMTTTGAPGGVHAARATRPLSRAPTSRSSKTCAPRAKRRSSTLRGHGRSRRSPASSDFSKPTLACIRGWCIGGGVNVAIACDMRIAASDSVFSSRSAPGPGLPLLGHEEPGAT
jgi:hypothetical protein